MPTEASKPANPEPALPSRLAGDQVKEILIVDDAQFLGLGLQRALRIAGFDSICVTSGARALEVVERQQIAVVLTDLRMPEMSGEELLEHLHRRRPDLRCIVMTGYATRDVIEHCAHMPNVAGILVKPLEYNRLFATLAKAMEVPPAVSEPATPE